MNTFELSAFIFYSLSLLIVPLFLFLSLKYADNIQSSSRWTLVEPCVWISLTGSINRMEEHTEVPWLGWSWIFRTTLYQRCLIDVWKMLANSCFLQIQQTKIWIHLELCFCSLREVSIHSSLSCFWCPVGNIYCSLVVQCSTFNCPFLTTLNCVFHVVWSQYTGFVSGSFKVFCIFWWEQLPKCLFCIYIIYLLPYIIFIIIKNFCFECIFVFLSIHTNECSHQRF